MIQTMYMVAVSDSCIPRTDITHAHCYTTIYILCNVLHCRCFSWMLCGLLV